MSELTEKQIKTRWVDIKKQIKERPLLAYRVGIPLEAWDSYMHSTPSSNEEYILRFRQTVKERLCG